MEEMETGLVDNSSDASAGSSSESSSQEPENGVAAQVAAPKQEQEIDWSKAFEHPRFKELVTEKNSALKQYQDMQSQYKAMEQQINSLRQSQPKAPSETDQLLEDLKKVDPRLANVIASQLQAAETTKSVQARLEAFEKQSQESAQRQVITTALSKINSLHETNKMSEFGKQFINNQLDLAYRGGKLDASDIKAVESAYSESLKAIKTYEDSFKRDVTKSYVQDKTKDASVPTSVPKGVQAKPAQKPLNVPKDKESLRSAVVKSFLKDQAANREATNN